MNEHRLPCVNGDHCGEPSGCPPVTMPANDYLAMAKAEYEFEYRPGTEPANHERASAQALIAIAESLRDIAASMPPDRCASDITLRDEEHQLVRCVLTEGHVQDHTDGRGVSWTGGQR